MGKNYVTVHFRSTSTIAGKTDSGRFAESFRRWNRLSDWSIRS
jgi:hypothetical protein